jgi:transketolase
MQISHPAATERTEHLQFLVDKADHIRRATLRLIVSSGIGHLGGSLSCVEILTVLYYHVLRFDPARPQWPERDRFVLSKGHACPTLYAILQDLGIVSEEHTMGSLGSPLAAHPDRNELPDIDFSSGSLGMGLSIANGMALGARLLDERLRVYVLLGDGELQEGQVWEAAMTAAHHRLGNLTAIVDLNDLQLDGRVEEIKRLPDLSTCWKSFGWRVYTVEDGHDVASLVDVFEEAQETDEDTPSIVLAKTIKGKGVDFMEGDVDYHSFFPHPEEEIPRVLEGLEGSAHE